ncbi:MAG: hypothetical protein KIT09_23180 [Bryobacteraceae bacterium]|nr:hypothetical protein [Bryobacteraceae bacterium]
MSSRGGPSPAHPRPDGTIIARIAPAPLDYIDPSALGYALNGGDQGVYATVSLLRVRQCVANQTNSSANLEQVLGHAIAHELGHLLPGEQSHPRAGLMQAGWGHKVLDDISKGRLFFSDGEARRIREAVARRTRHAARMPAPPS